MRAFLRSWKTDPVRRNLVLLVNAGGILFGFFYYLPQFEVTPVHLWPLVPDSPFAVLVATAALLLWGVGEERAWVDALAWVYMAKVGLWTAFVLALHPDWFGFAPFGTTLNTLLFYLHLGMVAEAAVFLVDLDDLGWEWVPILGWLLFNDAMDYAWTGYTFPGRTCTGLFPWTVPCANVGLVAAATVALSVGFVGIGWAWPRLRDAGPTLEL